MTTRRTAYRLANPDRFGMDSKVLYHVVRNDAMRNARALLESAGVADITDNSSGTASNPYTIASMVIPGVAFDASSAGGASSANFNTAFTAWKNAFAVMAERINNIACRIGAPPMAWLEGTIATIGTVPAQTLTVTSTSGASVVDFVTCAAAMSVMRNSMSTLIRATNMVLRAAGADIMTDGTGGTVLKGASWQSPMDELFAFGAPAITANPTAGTGTAAGQTSIAKTVMDTFLTNSGNNLATVILALNDQFGTVPTTAVTDSSTGTATQAVTSNLLSIAALAIPVAAIGAATTSSPKAGFDTQVGVIANTIAVAAKQLNLLLRRYGLTALVDNSAGTNTGTTFAAQSFNLTAVDGSTGTVAVDQVTGRARLTSIRNNFSTLFQSANDLATYFGMQQIVDNTGGTVSTTRTLEACAAATATGVGGVTAVTLLDADVDAYLLQLGANVANLALRMNAMIGANVPTKPLGAIAID